MTELRIKFLKDFDRYLRDADTAEEVYAPIWLYTYPDGADDDDLREIAEDEEQWLETVQCFTRCCRILGVIE